MAVEKKKQETIDMQLYFWKADGGSSDRLKLRIVADKITKKAVDDMLAQYKEFLYKRIDARGKGIMQRTEVKGVNE